MTRAEELINHIKEYLDSGMWKYEACDLGKEDLEIIIKALDQEPCEDVMAIHTQGLDEGIRCAMCTNSMKSDRGCDGGCIVDDEMYKRVMDTINNHILEQQSKKGHWICLEDEYGDVVDAVCSNCGANGNPDYMHYCPNCGSYNGGAKMEVEQ